MEKSANVKRSLLFVAVIVLVCAVFACAALLSGEEAVSASEETVLTLQIGNPEMTVNGTPQEIDPGRGTVPVLLSDRTLVPIRAIMESVGGTVGWDEVSQTVTLTYQGDTIRLVIDSTEAYLNDAVSTLDVAPVTINDRTMMPIRFIAEGFLFTVEWDEGTQTVTIRVPAGESPEETPAATPSEEPDDAEIPSVYMTTEITPEALVRIYNQLGFNAEGNVAVKMSTGEPPNSNYLRPELIKDLVQSVNGTIVECNTAYGGSRANTAMHYQVAEDHGFTKLQSIQILE